MAKILFMKKFHLLRLNYSHHNSFVSLLYTIFVKMQEKRS